MADGMRVHDWPARQLREVGGGIGGQGHGKEGVGRQGKGWSAKEGKEDPGRMMCVVP